MKIKTVKLIHEECTITEQRCGFKVEFIHQYIPDCDLDLIESVSKKLSTEFSKRIIEEIAKGK